MKSLFYLISIIVVLFLSRCSYDQDNIVYKYNPPPPNPCQENEKQILNQPGSPDAPILSIGIGIETGIVRISWTELAGTDFYVLEECDCPDFEIVLNSPTLFENQYFPDIGYETFFRVRASRSSWSTAWSNVIKNSS